MKCLIIAAGQGTRLRAKGEVKPLIPLLGVPLIERVIRSAIEGGADEFYVVTGHQGEQVANFLKQLAKRLNVAVTLIQNDDWQKENGFSVLKAGLAFINNIPVFIASDPERRWAKHFKEAGLPIIGDDTKSQLGATIIHRTLTDLFKKRGVKLERTYQLNTGGNTDFLNMVNHSRLASKKESKTEAVQAVAANRLENENIHIGPSDYVAWQKDNKICFIRMEGKLFGDVPMNLELRLSVEDSPNSAGVVIDAIRCAKLALDRKQGGILSGPSAYFCKHPPKQFTDNEAYKMTEAFIEGKRED